MSRITRLLGRLGPDGVYEINPTPKNEFAVERAALIEGAGTVSVRLRDDAHIKAIHESLRGPLHAALRQLDAEGKVTIVMKAKREVAPTGRPLPPKPTRYVTIGRGQVKSVELSTAYYLLGPDRWGLLFEEVDDDTGEPVRASDLPPSRAPEPTRPTRRARGTHEE